MKILLAHQPRSGFAAAAAGSDLQISGHTHGGQFLPWNFFVRLQQPFTAGLHRIGQLIVYVSRDTGYWGPPKRFGAPSEITCIRLVGRGHADEQGSSTEPGRAQRENCHGWLGPAPRRSYTEASRRPTWLRLGDAKN